MIPAADIILWQSTHPWADMAQVEQDLVISRAMVEIFSQPVLQESLLFRGGTALHKLFIAPASRYSEDIDLAQVKSGPIGSILDGIRSIIDPWLGAPKRSAGPGVAHLVYRYNSELPPVHTMKLKIETNTREHFSVMETMSCSFSVNTRWFSGTAGLRTYRLEELLGTKMRALYQRRKGRDLFDLWEGLTRGSAEAQSIVRCFKAYMKHEGLVISRREYEQNLADKLKHKGFNEELRPLLRSGVEYDVQLAATLVQKELISRLD